jgi:hypothetical protein
VSRVHKELGKTGRIILFPTGLVLKIGTVVGLVVLGAGVSNAQATPGTPEHKVWVCHATSSDTNPYEIINVDVASTAYEGHLMHKTDPNKQWKSDGTFGGATHVDGQAKPDIIGTIDAESAPAECFDIIPPVTTTTEPPVTTTTEPPVTTTTTEPPVTTTTEPPVTTTTTEPPVTTTTEPPVTTTTTEPPVTTTTEPPVTITTTEPPVTTTTTPPVVITTEPTVEVLGTSGVTTPPATPSVSVLGASASTNPLPSGASAGQASTGAQLAFGGLAAFATFVALGAGLVLRRRRGVV